jgi:hypothetical protein
MKKLFIESSGFTKWIVRYLDDEDYADFQRRLAENPDAGTVMPGVEDCERFESEFQDVKKVKGEERGLFICTSLKQGGYFYWMFTAKTKRMTSLQPRE